MTQQITTTDLSHFGIRERLLLVQLLIAWSNYGLPDGFCLDEVVPMMNSNSGCVFLTNSSWEVAMMNGDKLEIWNNCPNCGHEGFEEDCQLNDNGCNMCNSLKSLEE